MRCAVPIKGITYTSSIFDIIYEAMCMFLSGNYHVLYDAVINLARCVSTGHGSSDLKLGDFRSLTCGLVLRVSGPNLSQ
jgi:hypothetical protein